MLPKTQRLRAHEVRSIIANGRSVRATHLSARYIPGTQGLRAAVVVSKKLAHGAVERNRVRRAVYRALRRHRATGTTVLFVQKIPPTPLEPTFLKDILTLLP